MGKLSKQVVSIQTGDFAFKDKFFVAFVSATLATNPLYQPQLKNYFELVRFKVIVPDFKIENSPPIVWNFIAEFTVIANEYNQITVAEFGDSENSANLSVKIAAVCLNNPSKWIKLADDSFP